MTAKVSSGSAAIKLLVAVVLVLAVVAGLYAYRAKSTPSLEGTWGSKDLLGGMVITKAAANTYSVRFTPPSTIITLKGTLQGDTLHLPSGWPVCFKRAGGGLDEKVVSGGRVVAHWTKQ